MGVHSSQTIAPISLLAGGLSDGPRASTLVKVAVATAFGLAIYAPEANCMEGAMGHASFLKMRRLCALGRCRRQGAIIYEKERMHCRASHII